MNTPLTFAFRLDPAETVRAGRDLERRKRFAWVTRLFVPAMATLVVLFVVSGTPFRDLWWLGVLSVVVVVGSALLPLILRWQLRRTYAETPNLQGPQVYQFSDGGLSMSAGAGTTTLGWDSFVEVIETKEFFLFYYSKRGAFYLPKHATGDEAQRTALRDLLRAHLGPRAEGLRPT